MVALLSFIYLGKYAVAEAGINDFMLIASYLGIMQDANGEEGELIVVKKMKKMFVRFESSKGAST